MVTIMSDRSALDDAFERHPAVGSEPKDDYLFGRIHPHRFRRHGPMLEARVWAKSLGRHDPTTPFLIFGRPRSGTTLLVRLLDQVPGIRSDGELLHYGAISPLGLLSRLPRRAGAAAYGVKLLSYQLTEVQQIRRPLAFFDRVRDMGYRVIHLRRNTWAQTLSLARAQASQIYFIDRRAVATPRLRLDPAKFLALLSWNDRMLAYEDAVMAHVPHHLVQYETALLDNTRHQRTVDDICATLDMPSATVATRMIRTGEAQTIVNMNDLRAIVSRSHLAHLLPAQGHAGSSS